VLFTDLSLDHRLQKALADKAFSQATPVQQQAIPHALTGKDLLVSSKTGSGKTLAFLIPVLNRMLTQKALSKRDARTLVLAPTRELAKQVFNELLHFSKATGMKVALLVGGENYNDQIKVLSKQPAIVVGTPGRVTDHLDGRSLFLNGLEMLVLDEADRMLDLGFEAQLRAINQAADHRKRQTLLFSATLHSVVVNGLANDLQNKTSHQIHIDASDQANTDINQKFVFADHVEHKDKLLSHYLTSFAQANGGSNSRAQIIIFTATREDTSRIADCCKQQGFESVALSGDLLQSQRNGVMQSFSNQQQQVLVTTDVASRGLDIPSVAMVINFDLPKTADEYIHRIGRTGRSGNQGQSLSMVGPKDWPTFLLLKQQLTQSFDFETVSGLEAKFSGIKDKPKSRKASPWKGSGSEQANAGNKPRKKTVMVKTMEGKDVGDTPFLKKKPRKPIKDNAEDVTTDVPEDVNPPEASGDDS